MSDLQDKIRAALNGDVVTKYDDINQPGAREALINMLLDNNGWFESCKQVLGLSYAKAKELRRAEEDWDEVILAGAEEGLSRLAADGDYRATKDKLVALDPKKWAQQVSPTVAINVVASSDLDALHQIWQARQEVLTISPGEDEDESYD